MMRKSGGPWVEGGERSRGIGPRADTYNKAGFDPCHKHVDGIKMMGIVNKEAVGIDR